MSIHMDHPELENPVNIPFMEINEITGEMIMNTISKVMQSKKSLTLDNKMNFKTTVFKKIIGKGSKKGYMDYVFRKDCIVKVKHEEDNYCLFRAIILGQVYNDDKKLFARIINPKYNYQTSQAYKLAYDCNLMNKEDYGISEIIQIENFLQDYQIILIEAKCINQITYFGPEKLKKIILYCKDEHYYMIKSLPAFYEKENFCFKCKTAYNTYKNHPCNDVCKKCKNRSCDNLGKEIYKCNFCDVNCTDDLCLSLHMENVCGKVVKCVCGSFKTYFHSCTGKWCHFCKTNVPSDHKCFILREDEHLKTAKCKKGYIFFDYEAMHVSEKHVPNLVIAKKICYECIEHKFCTNNCNVFVFKENDSFCKWLFTQKYFIAIAHNMKAYDGYFIMEWIVNNINPNEVPPEIVLSGSKLLVIEFAKLKIIDSYNFIPMALAKLPKTFGIQEMKKGYFPHYFNTPENQAYVGVYPDQTYYGVDYMSCSDREAFLKWYETKQNEIFDLQKELLEYCISDVEILASSCLIFRKLFQTSLTMVLIRFIHVLLLRQHVIWYIVEILCLHNRSL